MAKYEAYKVSYSIVKDSTSIPTNATSKVTILMDAQLATAERAILIVKEHLTKQGHLSDVSKLADSISARRLKVFECTRLEDLGETIIADQENSNGTSNTAISAQA